MRLTILGGGGFRVPLVYRALLADPDVVAVDELVLADVDEGRLATMRDVLGQMSGDATGAPVVRAMTDLDEAVRGADFVLVAIRVGGLAGRVVDEEVPLAHGQLGQETTGAGGVSLGLRTVPEALRLARRIDTLAPRAWVINLTNPVGMVTEAMAGVLGNRVIGVCDSPDGLCRRVSRALGVDPAAAWFDYVGLNHLGWLRAVRVGGEGGRERENGRDRLPGLLAAEGGLGFEEGRLFGQRWLRALGAVPNEYLFYYYFTRDAVRSMRTRAATRAAFLHDQQERFYTDAARHPERALELWQRARAEREDTYMAESREAAGAGARAASDQQDGGYERVALAALTAIASGQPRTLVLDVPGAGALPALDATAAVELPCTVDAGGAHPLAAGPLPDHMAGLVTSVKAVERATIEAAGSGSRDAALRALALHPLVDSVATAERMLEEYVTRIPELAAVLDPEPDPGGSPG